MKKLTDKQRRFIEEYLVDFNGTAAAIRAGYSKKTAAVIGSENLRKPYLLEAIEKRMDELSMTAGEATMRLTQLARGTLLPFLRVAEDRVEIDLSTEGALEMIHLLSSVRQVRTIDRRKDGAESETVRTEVRIHDAKDALIQLAKIRGLYIERSKIEHDHRPIIVKMEPPTEDQEEAHRQKIARARERALARSNGQGSVG